MSAFGEAARSRLAGKTALITGASSGIGASTAILFASCGANVILAARRADKLAEVRDKCLAAYKAAGGKAADSDAAVVVEADMTSKTSIEALGNTLKDKTVDILVNNAGMVRGREQVGEIADEDIEVMIQTNVIGLIRLTQIIVRKMKEQGSGFIVNLGSIAGREAYVGGSIYCAAKFAVNAFSQSLMKELVNTKIRVCEIQPGMVETEFSVVRYRGDQSRADNEYQGLKPLTGDDIAEEIVWCASRPEHVQVAQMLIFPTAQAAATISYRGNLF